MIPQKYTENVNSGYKDWNPKVPTSNSKDVDMMTLENARAANPQSMHKGVYVNGVFVYSLLFEDDKVWSCQTGWTKAGDK